MFDYNILAAEHGGFAVYKDGPRSGVPVLLFAGSLNDVLDFLRERLAEKPAQELVA